LIYLILTKNKSISTRLDHTTKQELLKLQEFLYDLSARNPFIHAKVKNIHCLQTKKGKSLADLHKQAKFYQKEYGLDTTLLVHSYLSWKEPNKEEFYLSPFVYQTAKIISQRKIDREYRLEIDEGNMQLNPILRKSLGRFYDIHFPEDFEDIESLHESLIDQLSSKKSDIERLTSPEDAAGWAIVNYPSVGNFNYKKSLLGADYDVILEQNHSLANAFFSQGQINEISQDDLTEVVELDQSQRAALQFAQTNNLVIQGPPGTGKSQTIVGLIGSYLASGKKVLFVSQKRSALDVVRNRLKEIDLAHLAAYFNTEKDEKKSFYLNLKKSWEELRESGKTDIPKNNLRADLVDFYLSTYQIHDDRLGTSIFDLVKELSLKSADLRNRSLKGVVPSLADWKKEEDKLFRIEKQLQKHTASKSISTSFLINLNKAVFSELDPITKLDERLKTLITTLGTIVDLSERYNLTVNLKRFTQLSLACSILNMVNRSQLDILNEDSKSYKSFGNLAKKYHQIKLKVERAEQANKKWKNKPTKLEITELIDLLRHSNASRGILGILRRRNERLDWAFKDFDKNLSDIAKIQLLEELRNEWNLRTELQETELKLQQKYNVNAGHELDHILKLRNKLDELNKNVYMEILEHEQSEELIQSLSEIHPRIQDFNHLCRFIFNEVSKDRLSSLKLNLEQMARDIDGMRLLLPELQQYFKLPKLIRAFLKENPGNIEELTVAVAQHNLIEVTRLKTMFDELSGNALETELKRLIHEERIERQFNAKAIREKYKNGILDVDKLLTTPASKLKGDDKELKKRLKAQQRILMHEIAKSKQHMPIKEFIRNCWEILTAVHPVWIMNPLSVSERLPCFAEMFDVVIYDESSQIPLEDAVPSAHRAKQIIVVGDSKQMPPSSFFRTSNNSMTLLDQVESIFPKKMLKWHYRSEHPGLISFSNNHFYDNELLVLPPVDHHNPFDYHFIEGEFKDGKNITEAKAIADHISKTPVNPEQIGIIAFSKDQELEIRKQLSVKKINVENLLIRNLENVQGVERDHIIISVGYSKNEDGVLRMNFGPVNQESGSNRLNVLFTRSKKKISLFTSIKSSDFGLSDNYGVNCLKDYLSFVENFDTKIVGESSSFIELPEHIAYYGHQNGSSVDCFIDHFNASALLVDPCINEDNNADLYTIYNVMNRRFKSVKILLSQDRYHSSSRFENELTEFFKKKAPVNDRG
jgi:superfamily I DNA and/or RNA helicase